MGPHPPPFGNSIAHNGPIQEKWYIAETHNLPFQKTVELTSKLPVWRSGIVQDIKLTSSLSQQVACCTGYTKLLHGAVAWASKPLLRSSVV